MMYWRQVLLALFQGLSQHLSEVTKGLHMNLRWDSQCTDQESHWTPSEYERQALCLEPVCSEAKFMVRNIKV